MKVDNDTKLELTAAEHIRQMTEGTGWQLVKADLDTFIVDLQMIGNVEGATPEAKSINMEARMMATTILFNWLKNNVYGKIEQATNTESALKDTAESDFVDRG